jgi:hypothetical protein
MSLKYEQYYALYKTQRFMRDLIMNPIPKAKELRQRAHSCLRHFPFLSKRGEPIFSKDDFECPKIKELK